MTWKDLTLSGWGRNPVASSHACRPERLSTAAAAVKEHPSDGLLAHGGGRSYGDAALLENGHVLLTERLDRILDFDTDQGVLVCEPGVLIRDAQSLLIPNGYSLPAVPGTGFATIGGAVANDIHGKNHDRHGSFGDHVEWLDLLHADGEVRRVSPADDPELFAATIGGLGLTGIIVTVCVRLLPAPSNAVDVTEHRVRDLAHYFELMGEYQDQATYSVGWIDALSRGDKMGRGILETAEPSPDGVETGRARSRRIPIDVPGLILNRWSIALFNEIYYRRVPSAGRAGRVPLDRFSHPLDAIQDWNRLYGSAGFRQFQCVIPEADGAAGIRRLLEAVTESGAASFLAVLKTMGGEGRGYLSFPMRGFTLALDFPERPATRDVLARLEAITLEHNGRIYLAKDSCLSPEGFARMYPALDTFRQVLRRVDPDGLFTSDMARRLRIREAAA
ncbi:MAG: FAD-binding oxidoreductase [Alphaproteobacteria bacterium]|nr:FAD-binding oxidoreductase [Alphaproteobacteria bacterium]